MASGILCLMRFLSRISETCNTGYHKRNLVSKCHSIIFENCGDPCKVLTLKETSLPQLVSGSSVLVKFLACPINPADINIIQGNYGKKRALPAVAGLEGVAEVVEIGPDVKEVVVGDYIVPQSFSDQGTWQTHAVYESQELMPIPNTLPIASAATIFVNPCTAYRLLHDFAHLQPGDVIIQNGANSGVGEAVIQIAHHLGYKTINVIRNRPSLDELKTRLTSLGASVIITEEDLKKRTVMSDMLSSLGLSKVKLFLNCVGGMPTALLMKYLPDRTVCVTYGGMSQQPLTVPTASLIFNDLTMRGFWLTRWKSDGQNAAESKAMIGNLSDMIAKQTLRPPLHEFVDYREFRRAVESAMGQFVGKKFILRFDL